MSALTDAEDRIAGTWWTKRRTPAMARGEGCELIDEQGRRYLDFTSAYGTSPLGYGHPELVRALCAQAEQLAACPGNLYSAPRAHYLERLAGFLPEHLSSVFLCNSGTEANEAAIKFAALATGRSRLVAIEGGFHGRTIGALAATWNPAGRKPFERLLPEATFVARDDEAALDRAVDERVAAVLLEVIQGEGGVHPLSAGFLASAQRLCRERGALLIVDEVQTGFARTGTWFAHRHPDLAPDPIDPDRMAPDLLTQDSSAPDLITMAKGIGGGFPLGAVAYTERVAEALSAGCHGTTFGGNPLACAAGAATLDVLERERLDERAAGLGAVLLGALRERLARVALVREVRGRGLMAGVELRQRAGRYLAALTEEHGILALAAGPNVIRLLPPLICTEEQIDLVVDALAKALTA